MIKTKHDLNASLATLNLEEMIEATAVALGFARTMLERAMGELQQAHFKNDQMGAMFETVSVANIAEGLRKIQTNYHYLLEARDRDIVVKKKS